MDVLWLVVLFLFGIVLLALLVVLRLGVCRLLVMFVAWLLLMLILLVVLGKVSGLGVFRDSRSRPLRKRFRLNRKTPAHLVEVVAHSRPRVWKRLRQVGFLDLSMPDHSGRRCDHAVGGSVQEHDRVGVG